MDWDLWGSSYHQDEQESSYSMPPGLQCDFYFGYKYDVIEEDALNEKCCVQVLRILITKADTEIDELEQELVSLQNELALIEHKEWSEICCNALREKIDCLDTSIRSLRNKDDNDIEVQLLTHREPPQSVHEIVKALLKNYFQEKDKQPLDGIPLDSSSYATEHAACLLDVNELSNTDSNISVKEGTEEPSITEKYTSSNLSLKLHEKTNYPETIKPLDGIALDSSSYATEHAACLLVVDESSNNHSNISVKEETEEPNITEKCTSSNLSLKLHEKKTNYPETIKPLDGIALDSSSYATEHAACLLDVNESSAIDSNISVKEEIEEPSITEKCTSSNLSLKLHEKKTNYPETIKPLDGIALDSSSYATEHVSCLLDVNESSNTYSNISVKEGTEEPSITEKCTSSNLSLKLHEKKTNYPVTIKPLDGIALDSSSYATEHAACLLDVNESSNTDSNISVKEGTEEPSITEKCTSSNLSLKLHEKKTNYPEKMKPAYITIKNYRTDASQHAIGNSNKKKKWIDSNLKIASEEVEEHNSTHKENVIILGSSPKPGEKRTYETKKPAKIMRKGSGSDAIRDATGPSDLRQAESGNSDLDLKLSDFAQKNIRKYSIKELKIASTDKTDSSDSSLKTEWKRKNPPKRVKGCEADFTKTGHYTLTSLSEVQNQRGQNTTELLLVEEGKSQAEVQKPEVSVNDKKSIWSLFLKPKPQKQKEKRKINSDPPSVQEPAFPSIGIVSNSSVSKSKSQQKSGISTDDVNLNQSLNGKLIKRSVQPGQCEAKERGFPPDDSKSSVSQSQKKRKRTSNFPGGEANGSKEEFQNINSGSSIDSHTEEACTKLSSDIHDLNGKRLVDLRAIAKDHKLTKYHKLRKQVLIEQIIDQLGCC